MMRDEASALVGDYESNMEVDDVMIWYKVNVGIGSTFFVNSLRKSAMPLHSFTT